MCTPERASLTRAWLARVSEVWRGSPADCDCPLTSPANAAALLARMDSFIMGMLGPRLASLSGINEREQSRAAQRP